MTATAGRVVLRIVLSAAIRELQNDHVRILFLKDEFYYCSYLSREFVHLISLIEFSVFKELVR